MNNILDQFYLDPIGSYDGIFEDTTPLMEQYLTEATTGTTKRNLFQKMWDLLKKLVRLIINGLKRIAAWFKSLVSKRKKTASQAASDVFSSLGIKEPSLSKSNHKSLESNITTETISVIDDNGKINQEEIKIAITDYGMKILNHSLYFEVDITRVGHRATYKGGAANAFMHNRPGFLNSYLPVVISCCNNQSEFNSMVEAIEHMINSPTDENINNADEAYSKFANAVVAYDKYAIELDNIKYLTETLTKLEDVFNKANINDLRQNENAYITFNNVLDIMSKLQYGLNTITSLIPMSDRIDLKWRNSVHDVTTLDEVVKAFIEAGIPSSILAYNVAFMAGGNLAKYSDVSDIAQGQSRATLFPRDKWIVYKFATNQYGRMANRKDAAFCKLAEKADMSQYIAKVLKSEKNACVETAERSSLTPSQSQSQGNFNEDFKALKELFSKGSEFHRKTNQYLYDIHEDNVAYIGDRLVVLDYAD